MSTVKVTYLQVHAFVGAAHAYLTEHRKDKLTKFRYAVERVLPRAEALQRNYNEELEKIRVRNSATEKIDDQKIILMDGNSYRMTQEGANLFNQERVKLNESSVEIEAYVATQDPTDITEYQRGMFTPFVLWPESDEDRENRLFPVEEEQNQEPVHSPLPM